MTTRVIRTDVVRCPACGRIDAADVTYSAGDLAIRYAHVCPGCGLLILERDWERVEANVALLTNRGKQ